MHPGKGETQRHVPTIVVFGSTGQLGYELIREFGPLGNVVPITRRDVDLSDLPAVAELLQTLRPTLIINAAAYTNVDHSEVEPSLAFAINSDAPRVMAEMAAELNCGILHYSTDYVFDGRKQTPYCESDPTGPLNVYGESKLRGELAVRDSGAHYVVLRIGWLYSLRRHNFLRTIMRLMSTKPEIRVVGDQVGSPTWVRPVAAASLLIARALLDNPVGASGCYHLPSGGQASWYEFASEIARLALGTNRSKIVRVTTAEFGSKTERPAYSVLSGEMVRRRFGIQLPHWRTQLMQALEYVI